MTLSNKDPGVIINVNQLQADEISKISISEKIAVKITGKPSFTWSLASDKIVPPILDPLYKENKNTMNYIKKNINKRIQEFEILLNKYN